MNRTSEFPANAALAVQAVGLTKRFGGFTAVSAVTLSIPAGTVLGLLGPNGAGKTTLIRMLCGLTTPTSGSGHVLGMDIARQPYDLRRRLGYMSQRFSLYDDLTAEENLTFYGRLYGLGRSRLHERRTELLAWAGLAEKRRQRTGELATGWRQRLAFACATIHQPDLVFLDEPTSGVDPLARRNFWAMIYDLAAGGTTLVVTTHALEEAEFCDRLALMSEGQLVAGGPLADLRAEWAAKLNQPVAEVTLAQVFAAATAYGRPS